MQILHVREGILRGLHRVGSGGTYVYKSHRCVTSTETSSISWDTPCFHNYIYALSMASFLCWSAPTLFCTAFANWLKQELLLSGHSTADNHNQASVRTSKRPNHCSYHYEGSTTGNSLCLPCPTFTTYPPLTFALSRPVLLSVFEFINSWIWGISNTNYSATRHAICFLGRLMQFLFIEMLYAF